MAAVISDPRMQCLSALGFQNLCLYPSRNPSFAFSEALGSVIRERLGLPATFFTSPPNLFREEQLDAFRRLADVDVVTIRSDGTVTPVDPSQPNILLVYQGAGETKKQIVGLRRGETIQYWFERERLPPELLFLRDAPPAARTLGERKEEEEEEQLSPSLIAQPAETSDEPTGGKKGREREKKETGSAVVDLTQVSTPPATTQTVEEAAIQERILAEVRDALFVLVEVMNEGKSTTRVVQEALGRVGDAAHEMQRLGAGTVPWTEPHPIALTMDNLERLSEPEEWLGDTENAFAMHFAIDTLVPLKDRLFALDSQQWLQRSQETKYHLAPPPRPAQPKEAVLIIHHQDRNHWVGYIFRRDTSYLYFDPMQLPPPSLERDDGWRRVLRTVVEPQLHLDRPVTGAGVAVRWNPVPYVIRVAQRDACSCGVYLAKWWQHILVADYWKSYGVAGKPWARVPYVFVSPLVERAQLIARFVSDSFLTADVA